MLENYALWLGLGRCQPFWESLLKWSHMKSLDVLINITYKLSDIVITVTYKIECMNEWNMVSALTVNDATTSIQWNVSKGLKRNTWLLATTLLKRVLPLDRRLTSVSSDAQFVGLVCCNWRCLPTAYNESLNRLDNTSGHQMAHQVAATPLWRSFHSYFSTNWQQPEECIENSNVDVVR